TRLRVDRLDETASQNPLVEKLAARWKGFDSGWKIEQSAEVLDLGGSVFIPDFVFRNSAGKEKYVEILGFWTPRYLSDRLKELERSGFKDFLLAASSELRGSHESAANLPLNVVIFKTSLEPRELEASLDKLADQDSPCGL